MAVQQLKGYLLENLGLKLFSLFIAIVAWAIIQGQQSRQATVQIALEVIPPENPQLVVGSDLPAFVKAEIRAPLSTIRVMQKRPRKFRIDLSKEPRGSRRINILAENLRFPKGVDLRRIVPAFIDIRIEEVGVKLLEVKPRIKGEPAIGFYVSSVNLTPKEVRVTGPGSRVSRLQQVYTQPISVLHRTGDFRVTTALDLPGREFRSEETVQADVKIEEKVSERRFEGVPIRFESEAAPAPQSITIDPERIIVVVEGAVNDLNDLSKDALRPIVRTDRSRGIVSLTPELELPSNVRLVRTEPDTVRVELK